MPHSIAFLNNLNEKETLHPYTITQNKTLTHIHKQQLQLSNIYILISINIENNNIYSDRTKCFLIRLNKTILYYYLICRCFKHLISLGKKICINQSIGELMFSHFLFGLIN